MYLDPLIGSERVTAHAQTDSTSSRASVIRHGSAEGQAIMPHILSGKMGLVLRYKVDIILCVVHALLWVKFIGSSCKITAVTQFSTLTKTPFQHALHPLALPDASVVDA